MNTKEFIEFCKSENIVDKIHHEIRVEILLAASHVSAEGLNRLIKDYTNFAIDNISRNLDDKCFYYGVDGCIGTYELCIEKAMTDDEEYLRILKCNECGRYMKIETFEDYCKKAETRALHRADLELEKLTKNIDEIDELKEQIADIRGRTRILKDRIKEHKKLATLYRWK